MTTFKLDSEANIGGTSKRGTLNIPPSLFLTAFGPGNAGGDDCKVDQSWSFSNSDGEVFTCYAFKATNLYEDDLPTPDDFWAGKLPYEFSIGGKGPVLGFKNFILSECFNSVLAEFEEGEL